MATANKRIAAALSLFVISIVGCRKGDPEEHQEMKAMEEVMLRTSLAPSLAISADKQSERFYANLCMPHASREWRNSLGVTRAIDIIGSRRERVRFEYCVNTDTWEIAPDDEFTAQNSIDNTKLLNAKHFCSQLTDKANAIRKRK